MQRIPRQIKSFDGVGWGKKASAKLSGGPTYHEIIVETNLSPEHLSWVTITKNGDTVFRASGEDLKFQERYKKQWDESRFFVLALGDISLFSLEGQTLTGLTTVPGDNIMLEVEVVSIPTPDPLGGSDPTIEATAYVGSTLLESPVSLYLPRLRRQTFKAGTSGELILDNVHRRSDGKEFIRRLHLDGRGTGAQDLIDRLVVKRDDVVVFEQYKDEMRFNLKRRGRAPQTGWYHFDPLQSGFISDLFDTAHIRDLEFVVTLGSSAASIPALIETVERVDQNA